MPDPTPAGPLLLGLDLGTSSIKTALFHADGTVAALEQVEYLQIPEGQAIAEADAEAYWQATCAAIRRVIGAAGAPAESIAALAISSHGETLFCLDAAGRPTRPAILTLDVRAEEEAAAIAASLGAERIYQLTGQPEVLPIWPAAKILWLRRHEPGVFARTAHYMLPQGYILHRLCGEYADDPSVQTTTLLLDVQRLQWAQPLLDCSGLSPEQLPRLMTPGTVVGALSPAAQQATGLGARTRVVMGALDQLCAAVGAGNIRPGVLTESTGSVLALVATTPAPVLRSGSLAPCYPHALPGLYCLLPWHQTGGLALKWFRDRLAPGAGYGSLDEEAATVPAGCDGLLVLPHLAGAQFPVSNPAARGVFFGVGLQHTRAHMARAILEAIAYQIRHDIETLQAWGMDIREIVSLGGGARSDLWLQIKADVCGLPVRTLETEQAAMLGAAILAAVGARLYTSVPAAVAAMSRPGLCYEPQVALAATYDRAFAAYLRLYQHVADLF